MDSVDRIVDHVIRRLQGVKDGAQHWNDNESTRRNMLALQASNNNLNEAREIKMLANSQIPNKLQERYNHCKYWENQFNEGWGGHDNTYAGWCHKEAKDAYYDAILECKALGETVTRVLTLGWFLSSKTLTPAREKTLSRRPLLSSRVTLGKRMWRANCTPRSQPRSRQA
mmetsp:Transcript_19166/g.27724  ORF Transcript_19166/g.27724 Transcript_19166/m.27724 type:complete len:170 (+) Transcript_19166:397-906(+)